nr:L-2-amino-thiazoline-4-carboxylic acid hydrolase [Bacteroidota bacterium]
MKKSKKVNSSRRDFITKAIPGCALSCFAFHHLVASETFNDALPLQDDRYKFEAQMDREITLKQWHQNRHNKYIGILNELGEEIGKEKLIEMLQKASYEENVKLGKQLSNQIKSLNVFANPFRNESSNLSKSIVREIVEDTKNAFEIRVTDCVTEVVFREANALDLGYACVCYADYGLPEGINPKLKLIRTKTLMQGHDCCNHRYVWEK